MIAVDTPALMALVLGDAEADACITVLAAETEVLVSAGTVAETLLVAARRDVGEEMARLIDGLGFEIVVVTSASARRIPQAHGRWGKGLNPAGLNSAAALPMRLPRSIRAGCSSSATTVRRPTSRSSRRRTNRRKRAEVPYISGALMKEKSAALPLFASGPGVMGLPGWRRKRKKAAAMGGRLNARHLLAAVSVLHRQAIQWMPRLRGA